MRLLALIKHGKSHRVEVDQLNTTLHISTEMSNGNTRLAPKKPKKGLTKGGIRRNVDAAKLCSETD
jgi:hypothetical protein